MLIFSQLPFNQKRPFRSTTKSPKCNIYPVRKAVLPFLTGPADTVSVVVDDNGSDNNKTGDKAFGRLLDAALRQPCCKDCDNKHGKTPLQIITDISEKIDSAVVRLPPLMLDWLGPDYITRDELSLRGYYLPCYPYCVASQSRDALESALEKYQRKKSLPIL
jgi:hypothetical protein